MRVDDYRATMHRFQASMRDCGAVVAVFSGSDQMRYLTGWAAYGHERLIALFVPANGDPVFLVPTFHVEQARSNSAEIAAIVGWNDEEGWRGKAREIVNGWGIGDAGVVLVDDDLYASHLIGLQELFPSLTYRLAGPEMARLRAVKTDEELVALTRAAEIIDIVFEETVDALRTGITEADVQEFVQAALKRQRSSASFTPLICFGANGAMPHHDSGERALVPGDVVVIDIGATFDHYASDITRTIAFGEPADPDAANVYEIVYRAHMAGRDAVRPGVVGEQVDAVARAVIEQAGYGAFFTHRTGHGIGLSTHEPPYIVKGNNEPLKPAMCFSVEPGIYLPGRFGARVENIVTVTPDGCRSLNAEPSKTLRAIPAR